jgi:hypothetical protein
MSKAPDSCDKCKSKKNNTLYDMDDSKLICLSCVPSGLKDSPHPSKLMKVVNAAVTGLVNLERRRRTIAKRT